MTDIISSSFNDESINVVLNYQPPNLVNVEDDINQTRVILRQPATVVNVGERPLLEYAEVALSASYAKSASFIADDSDIYDWVRTTFYVSATDGNDDNDGKTPIYPFKTIKRAARAAKEFITGSRLIDPTIPEEAPRVTIRLSTGFYEEEAPIQIPEWTSVCGNDLRTCVVRPTPATKGENLFQVNRGFYADGLRLEGCEIDDLTNPRKGFFFAFQEGAYITTSPYIQNCTAAFVPFDKFYAPLDAFATPQPNPEIGNGPGGMIVDDSVLDPYSPLKSMIVDAYTQVAFNGIGLVVRGAGYAQMVSFFTNFSHVGTWAIDGGHASLLNSNTTFGDYGLRAEGYRVIVVPDYDGVNSYQSEADSLLVSQSINDVRNYMMTQLQLSGSYRTDYLDTSSRIHQLTLKDSGLLIDAIATDLLALTPGKTVNWIQSQFKGQDVSADKRYTIPTSSATSASGYVRGPYAAFRINDNTYTASVPFTQPSASRDSGYLINAVATDILYGGNERSVEAARWFWVRPSVANTSQLQPTLDGIQIVKELAQNALEAVSQSAFVSKSSAGIQLSYDVLEQGGTASLSVPVPNTFDPIKVTNLSSVTSATTISQSLVNQATASFEIVYSIITDGTGSMPPLVTNAENLIRVTTASAQFTTASSAVSKAALVVSGFNTVLNIIENGTGSLPTTVLNTANNIKVTVFAPTTSSASATLTEVSSSETLFNVITSIITNGTGSLPIIVYNTEENIKFTDEPQVVSGSISASSADVQSISGSIALVADIVRNGTGSLPGVVPYTTQSSDPNTIAAYYILKDNIEFIKKEVIAYISSSWSTASYNEASCSRDIGYIVSGAAEDLLYGSNSASLANGIYYYLFPSEATGNQLNFTLDGINYANRLAQKVVQNVSFVTASVGRRAAWQLMRQNIPFIREEVIAYVSSSWPTASYDQDKCKRDVGYIVDSVSTDILYGGNERSIEAGRYYYLYPNQATTSQLNFTIDAINYAKGLAKKLIVNTAYSAPNSASWAAKELLTRNKPLIQAEVIQYISSSWVTSSRSMVGFVYDQDKCFRDVGYILDGVATDILYGGNERSIESGRYYYLYPNEATNNRTQLDPTLDGIEYARNIAVKIVSGSTLVTASANSLAARELLNNNRAFIQAETIAFLSSSWRDFNYSSVTCSRDIGYIIDAVKTDLVYGGNQRSRDAGFYYYKYPNQATSAQDAATVAGVRYAKNLAQRILQNATFVTASADRIAASNALFANKAYIQEQVVTRLLTNKTFDEADTLRDSGYIIQAVATDILYGGNERSTEAGRYFYKFPSGVLNAVKSETLEGIALVKEYAQNYLESTIAKSEIPSLRDKVDIVYDILENGTGSIANVLIPNASGATRFTNEPQFTSSATISSSLIESASNVLQVVLDIIEYGTGSIPTLVKNTSGRIKRTTSSSVQYTGSISQSLINLVTASADVTIQVLEDGTGSLPTLIPNTINNIKVTDTTQYTGSVTASSTEITKVSSSFALVTNILINGTGSLPALVLNTSESIKYTGTAQVTSSATASSAEVTKVSSSVASVVNVIINGTGSLPAIVLNTAENIKFTTASQVTTSSYTANGSDITAISASIALVANIVRNGTGSLPTVIPYTTQSTNPATITAYNLIKSNIPLIQAEVIAYISSSWSTASYNEASCSRDIGYIVSGAAEDLLYGSNSASLANGIYYYLFPSEATGNQVNFTVDGINFGNYLTQKIANNTTLVTASQARRNTWNLLRQNKQFVQDETIAWLSASWYGFDYDSAKCHRDIGYIIDGVATDIYYGGNERSRESGRYYYLYPSQATGSQLDPTVDGIEHAGILAQKVIQSIAFVTASESRQAVRSILYSNIPLLQNETVAYISSSWSTASYNEAKCKRDVGYIVGGIIADVLYGGNQRTRESGIYYYTYPSQATGNQLDFTVDGVNYASRIAQKLLVNTELSLPTDNVFSAYKVARANKEFIAAEVIPYISSSWSTLDYNSDKCRRDVTYIVDGITTDFLYGGNERSIQSGYYYYYIPSEVTGEQVEETSTGIRYIANLVEAIMQGATFSLPTQNQLDAAELLFNNKQFIAEEIIPYVSASWSGSTYNGDKCKRDVGYILDGVITDIVYGGNERSIQSGLFYYLYPSVAVTSELDFTYAGTRYLKGMAIEVLKNTVFQEVDPVRQFVFDTLVANKAAIAQAVLDKLLDGQEKCMVCDYILAHNKIREYLIDDPEGRLTDLTPAAKVKIGQLMAMVTGTLESVVLDLQPTYLQEFGSLITSTSHVFEFGGSGANYLALPSNQYGIGQSSFDIRVFQADGGRIFTSFGDETGDFFIGLDFTIRQATGTIEGRTFNKATAARFTPLILALT